MSLLIFICIVLVVLCLVYWAITLIPLPATAPAALKTILLIVAILLAAFVILERAGLLHG